ncbi:MAG: radical SAM family heme chaperone HemW, partial [Pseudomonadota bacterium]
MPPTADSDFGLYVHLPWCVSKCPYCDFNSHALKTPELPEAAYVDALVRDLAQEARLARDQGWHRPFDTVFFGGGTPSLFSAGAIGRILEAASADFGVNPGAEITLEANPGTVERTSFPGLAAAGVNRVSLGAQSFDDDRLKALGRVHRAADTADAVEEIRRGGIDNINIDVMYALPGQSIDGALADLDAALALNPSHLSHYQLTLEPNTLFHHDPPELPDDDTAWTIHERSLERLAAAGFAQYEISAYAHAGQTARHNLVYWRFGDYVGIGAGAH